MTSTTWTRSELAGTNGGIAGPIKMWTPPKPRAYTPKATDPGQRITWTRHVEGHHTHLPENWRDPFPADDQWIPAYDIERTGTIWSAGDSTRSVWVQPDDAPSGDMVLVHTVSLQEQTSYDRDWQRDTTRRCNNLAVSAGLIREVKAEQRWGDRKPQDYLVAYHCDPACPAIKYRTDDYLVPAIGDVIRDLLDHKQRTDLCDHCIWLNQPAAVAA